MSLIFLIGLPGSGKSSLAPLLAQALRFQSLDTDALIEEKLQTSIAQYIENQGFESFREKERALLQSIFSMKNSVVATGGGLPCFFDNLQQMKAQGLLLYLNPPLHSIAPRLLAQAGQRPLFAGANDENAVLALLENLHAQRRSFYEQAHLEITQTDDLQSIINKIKSL